MMSHVATGVERKKDREFTKDESAGKTECGSGIPPQGFARLHFYRERQRRRRSFTYAERASSAREAFERAKEKAGNTGPIPDFEGAPSNLL